MGTDYLSRLLTGWKVAMKGKRGAKDVSVFLNVVFPELHCSRSINVEHMRLQPMQDKGCTADLDELLLSHRPDLLVQENGFRLEELPWQDIAVRPAPVRYRSATDTHTL
jgi:hypothetical protein